ncbi:MAG TPA: PepSY domain-containing protein [Gammaproteobacteria bacterium]|nr:PepSY domain-containing protein [Gammaproteobacteria bacterium]
MTRHPRTKSRTRLLRSLYIWHRYIGLVTALFVFVLSLTGLALNHTEALQLDARHVRSDALLDWYGIHAPDTLISYRAGPDTISQLGNHIYWNRQLVPATGGTLSGAVQFAGLTVAGLDDSLLLFTREGDLIEQLGSAAGAPTGIQAVGTDATGKLAVRTVQGIYRTDENFIEWQPATASEISWAGAAPAEPQLEAALRSAWRGTGLPLERVLLDLHSGRILGETGVWLVDAAALLFLFLASSGLWLWGRRRASARERSSKTRGSQP